MPAQTPDSMRANNLFIWSCGLLVAMPIWFGIMLVLASAVGVHGDSGSAVVDAVGSLVTLAPGIASMVLAGLAFRADHRWWYLIPPGVVVATMALLVVPSYLDGQAETWSLLVPLVAVAPTVVAALWPHGKHSPAATPATRRSAVTDDPRKVG